MSIQQVVSDKGSMVAAGMVASPWWLPWLKQSSEVVGYLVPFLGAAYLILKFYRLWKDPKRTE